jgi:hypothetical protein
MRFAVGQLSSAHSTVTILSHNKIGLTILVLAIAALSLGTANAQCPAIGADTTCGVVITITNTGATVSPTGQEPYDTIDDTLVGVVNNGSLPVTSVVLTSGNDIFSFDGDGICGISPITGLPYVPSPPACPYEPTGYEGPGISFSNIISDATTGTVTFSPPIPANGGTAYFSLENALGSATVVCPTICTSEIVSVARKVS